jgi:hypothetical protein
MGGWAGRRRGMSLLSWPLLNHWRFGWNGRLGGNGLFITLSCNLRLLDYWWYYSSLAF